MVQELPDPSPEVVVIPECHLQAAFLKNDTFHSIQFILYSSFSQLTNVSQSALQSLHIDIPVPGPHIGSGTTPQKIEKTLSQRKKGRNLQERTEEDPSPGWTGAICLLRYNNWFES